MCPDTTRRRASQPEEQQHDSPFAAVRAGAAAGSPLLSSPPKRVQQRAWGLPGLRGGWCEARSRAPCGKLIRCEFVVAFARHHAGKRARRHGKRGRVAMAFFQKRALMTPAALDAPQYE